MGISIIILLTCMCISLLLANSPSKLVLYNLCHTVQAGHTASEDFSSTIVTHVRMDDWHGIFGHVRM